MSSRPNTTSIPQAARRGDLAMIEETRRYYEAQFGTVPAHVMLAPGRLEILGNHTDYNEGLVLSMAVDRWVGVAAAPRLDGRVVLASSALPQRHESYADRLERSDSAPWTDYVKGVLHELRRRGVPWTGFNLAVHSNLPIGAGMSSSAALTVATALIVRELFPHTVTDSGLAPAPARDRAGNIPALTKAERIATARLCQQAEIQFSGVNVGLLDPLSILLGREGHLMAIDFREVSVASIPLIPGYAIVVCDSGAAHSLPDGAYNKLRAWCEEAAKALGVRTLREADPRALASRRDRMSARAYDCARHVLEENARVVGAERALRDGDAESFGAYLWQSHESSRDLLGNSTPALDLLVRIARDLPGCLGARLTGGGFGGSTLNWVREADLPAFIESMRREVAIHARHVTHPLVCRSAPGAGAD